MTTITKTSHDLFLDFARDACKWSGTPLSGGNVGGSKEERGNLTQLKKAGLITTSNDGEGHDWLSFTDLGVDYAAEHGVEVDERQPLGNATRITVKDAKVKPAPIPVETSEPKIGSCARIHQLCEQMKGQPRNAILKACEAEGLHKSTIRIQATKWAKLNGHVWPTEG